MLDTWYFLGFTQALAIPMGVRANVFDIGAQGCSTARTYGRSTDTGVRIYRYGHSTFMLWAYMYVGTYGHSTFTFLSNLPYIPWRNPVLE